jgi:ligand-binding sensor domain-containing protein
MLRRLFLIGIFFFFCCVGFSQSPVFKQFTVDDGLPSNEIYEVIQDTKGYMWFATNYGASCFDGYKFTNYDSQKGLPDNTILEIFEDYKERIWFIPITGKLSYYFNGKIFLYKYNDVFLKTVGSFTHIFHNSFDVDSLDNVYIGVNAKGIYKISTDGKVTAKYKKQPPYYATIHLEKNKKAFYDCTPERIDGSAFNVDWGYGNQMQVPKMPDSKSGRVNVLLNKNNELIFTKGEYIRLINHNEKIITKKSEFGTEITALTTDKSNNVWVCTLDGGVYCYKNGNVLSKPIYHYLNGKSASYVFEDKEGGYWFSTVDAGVFYMHSNKFITYSLGENFYLKNISTISNYINNQVIIGGIGDSIYIINNPIEKIATTKYFNEINCLFFDSTDNTLWIGTNGSIFLFKNNTFKAFNECTFQKNKETQLYKNYKFLCYEIIKAKNNYIYAASNVGLFEIRNKNEIEYFFPESGVMRINAIAPAFDSSVWIGTNKGLWKFIDRKFFFLGDENKSFSYRINTLKMDTANSLWIGTKGYGLIIKMQDTIVQLLEKDGLTSNNITSLSIQNNIVWACSSNGLNKIEVVTEKPFNVKIEQITINNGLQSNEVSKVHVDGNIVYAATNKGLTIFDFSKISMSKFSPPIYITGIKVMGRDTAVNQFLEIPYDKSLITINFVGLCYKKAGDVQYKYRLVGLSDEWTFTKNNYVQFPYLPHGDYTFEVIAFNEDGFPSDKPAILHFTINPPFWKTWWFVLLSSLTVMMVFLLIYKFRINEIQKKSVLKDELNRYMQQALAKQMNPHFIFNALNSIHNFILENDKNTSSYYLSKFSSLMRQTLDNSTKETITLGEEILTLKLYLELEQLRFKHSFDYSINMTEDIDDSFIEIPPFLLQPYIENSLWHGIMHKTNGQGNVKLDFSIDEEFIVCSIEDNGIGRDKAAEIKAESKITHKSRGTSITEKRIALINSIYGTEVGVKYYDLKDDQGNATGTNVTVKISMR